MTSRPTLAEPIAKFFKSARDRSKHVRVELSEYEGHPLINIRVWQSGSDGIDRPTKQGIALAIRKLPELARALAKALKRAQALGLLDGAQERNCASEDDDATIEPAEAGP